MYKELEESEKKLYQEWARENYLPYSAINALWHPEVRGECYRINRENDDD